MLTDQVLLPTAFSFQPQNREDVPGTRNSSSKLIPFGASVFPSPTLAHKGRLIFALLLEWGYLELGRIVGMGIMDYSFSTIS